MAFSSTLTPTPTAGKGIPYTWFTQLLENTNVLKQGDVIVDRIRLLQVDITTTGTVNDHDPDGAVIRCNNASALVINGLVPAGDNDVRIYLNVGTSTLKFAREHASSAAANRFILPAAFQWIGPDGAIGFYYDATSDRWRVLFIEPGDWITESSPTFSGSGGVSTWTSVDVTTYKFRQNGANLAVAVAFDTSTVTGAGTTLTVTMPGGLTASGASESTTRMVDGGTSLTGYAFVTDGATVISFRRIDEGNIGVGSNATYVRGTFDLEVKP